MMGMSGTNFGCVIIKLKKILKLYVNILKFKVIHYLRPLFITIDFPLHPSLSNIASL